MMPRAKKLGKGLLISFEGGEGAGKSTQIRHLEAFLKSHGFKVLITLEPGGSTIGKGIRGVLLNPDNKELSHRAELLLYEADRAQHMDEVVFPALEKGVIVLSDRGQDSSTVYQGLCRGFGKALVEKMNQFATNHTVPDLTFIFDLDEKLGRSRVRERLLRDAKLHGIRRRVKLDRLEREKLAFHQKVRKGFLKLAREDKKRFKIIDASGEIPVIQSKIESIAIELLVRKKLWQNR